MLPRSGVQLLSKAFFNFLYHNNIEKHFYSSRGDDFMSKYFQKHFADILLSALYIALCATAQILPDETAFVFCSEQYDKYVNLWLYIYVWTDQFRPVWPWQR